MDTESRDGAHQCAGRMLARNPLTMVRIKLLLADNRSANAAVGGGWRLQNSSSSPALAKEIFLAVDSSMTSHFREANTSSQPYDLVCKSEHANHSLHVVLYSHLGHLAMFKWH